MGLLLFVTMSAACSADNDSPGATATPVRDPGTVSPSGTSAPVPATAAPSRPPGQTGVSGLFTDPRPSPSTSTRSLAAAPASAFPAWDGVSTMLYDVVGLREINLGPGSAGRFSPDGSKMAWVAGGTGAANAEVWVLDLKTQQRRNLGPGRTADWFDSQRVITFLPNSNDRELINVAANQREPIPSAMGPDAAARDFSDGSKVRRVIKSDYPYLTSAFTFIGPDGRILLEFDAYQVEPAGTGEIVVATPPASATSGTTNIFIVNVNSGVATFVATSRYTQPNWPLGGNADYVVWTEGYCGAAGNTRIYDRRTGTITELQRGYWVTMTPGGLLGVGEFGPAALVDPTTLQYRVVIRVRSGQTGPAVDVFWSPLYTYASRGQTGGHGGLCG